MHSIEKRLIRFGLTCVACSVLILNATTRSIRDVNLRNFRYPFVQNRAVPETVRWMPSLGQPTIELKGGRHVFASDECRGSPSGCPLLNLDSIQYGAIASMPREIALVVMTYHTGGTATWQYVYVISLQSGRPEVIAWIETGSRGRKGLQDLSIDHGELVLVVNDSANREGDCCSSGGITARYRWRDGSFQEVGPPVPRDSRR